jgi:hypothetical protein
VIHHKNVRTKMKKRKKRKKEMIEYRKKEREK